MKLAHKANKPEDKKTVTLSIKTAERVVQMSTGEPWRLRFDHAAIYELEEQTGESMPAYLEQMNLEVTAAQSMKRLYDFAWFLSASHRALNEIEIAPAKFRAMLPQGQLSNVADLVGAILTEVFPSDPSKKSAIRPVGELAGNGTPAQAESTGANASTSP